MFIVVCENCDPQFHNVTDLHHILFQSQEHGRQPLVAITTPKQQSFLWKRTYSPHLKEVRHIILNIKGILMMFDCEVIFHQDFVPSGQTVNWH